jgi:predicted nucleic acid-binding protein
VTLIVDASAVVAALLNEDAVGGWAEETLQSSELIAPHLMPAEVAETLRRSVLRGNVSADLARLAHGNLTNLQVKLFPYSAVAARAWELRGNLTLYDAWYVALAEGFETDLVTLDRRLTRAPGPRCGFRVPGT